MSGKNQTRSTTRSQRQPSNRLLDGFSSSSPARPLEDLNRTELAELRDRNRRMLDNPSLLQTLPDKGAKLKDVNARIEKLLSTDANEDEYQRPDIRQKTVDSANAKAKQLDSGLHTQSSTSTKETSEGSTGQQQTRVRMMGLDESVRLQELQLQQIKEENMKKQMEGIQSEAGNDDEANELSATFGRLRLGHNDSTDEDETTDEDSDEERDSVYESEEDEGFEDYIDDRR